jgi:SNF2 family DNA or RNA helicase
MSKSYNKANITVENDNLLIRFNFNKSKFDEIKTLRHANYDKTAKCWRLPIEFLNKLEKLKSFRPENATYEFDRELLIRRADQLTEEKDKIRNLITQNPYSVPIGLILKADLPVYFCLLKSQPGVALKIPRFSKLKSKIQDIPGIAYIKSENAFYLPTHYLNILIKKLKKSKVAFAVETELANLLKSGAKFRNQALAGDILNYDQLRNSLLMPIVTYDSNANCYKLLNWHTEQLRYLIPWIENFKDRKNLSFRLNANELLKLLEQAELNNITIWLDQMAHKNLYENYNNKTLFFSNFDLCFYSTTKRKIIFLFKSSLINQVPDILLKDAVIEEYPILTHYTAFLINFNKLREIHEVVLKWASEKQYSLFITRELYKLLELAEQNQQRLARQEYFKTLKDIKIESENEFYNSKLFPHQRVAVSWLLETPRALLGDDMGLGKTLSVLATYNILKEKEEIDFVCIVCPFSLVKNWQNEANNWFDNIFIASLPTSAKAQVNFFRDFRPNLNAQGLVINFETFRLNRIYSEIEKIAKNHRVWLVIDESQRVKNAKSKAFEALATVSKQSLRCTLLSGTPTPKDLTDIWSQMYLLDQGERLGTNFYDWLKDVAELGTKWSDFAVKKFIPEKVEYVKSRVHELLLRRKKEDVVNLPEKIFSTRDIELKGNQFEKYEEVRKELLLRINALDGTEYVKEIKNVMEEFLRAVQIASNPRLVDPSWTGEPAKFTELDEIVNEVIYGQDDKIVIWTNYVNNVLELVERYKDFDTRPFYGAISKTERDKTITCFQNETKKARILVAVPAAGGVGITLTAARTAVYIDKTWNAEHWLQSVDRIHRIGQTGTVNIISLQACLIDYLISKSLTKKTLAQKDLIDNEEFITMDAYPHITELKDALR